MPGCASRLISRCARPGAPVSTADLCKYSPDRGVRWVQDRARLGEEGHGSVELGGQAPRVRRPLLPSMQADEGLQRADCPPWRVLATPERGWVAGRSGRPARRTCQSAAVDIDARALVRGQCAASSHAAHVSRRPYDWRGSAACGAACTRLRPGMRAAGGVVGAPAFTPPSSIHGMNDVDLSPNVRLITNQLHCYNHAALIGPC
jgi:hypothetical protein